MAKMYFMSKMKFELSIPIEGKEPLKLTETIQQLVYATDKDKAREAVIDDLKKQYADAKVWECRIDDTIIGA